MANEQRYWHLIAADETAKLFRNVALVLQLYRREHLKNLASMFSTAVVKMLKQNIKDGNNFFF